MVRALFVEYPGDPGSWQVEDEYLFGSDILVARCWKRGPRDVDVYILAGGWHNIQAGQAKSTVRIYSEKSPAIGVLSRTGYRR